MVSRLLLCVFFALVATAVASAAPRATTDLNIVVWPHSKGGTGVKRWTLRCGPVGGQQRLVRITHPAICPSV